MHPLVTPYQVSIEISLGVLCAGTKNVITVPAKSRRSFYTKSTLAKMTFYLFFRRDSNPVTFMLHLLRGSFFSTFQAQKNVASKQKDLTRKCEMHEHVVNCGVSKVALHSTVFLTEQVFFLQLARMLWKCIRLEK